MMIHLLDSEPIIKASLPQIMCILLHSLPMVVIYMLSQIMLHKT